MKNILTIFLLLTCGLCFGQLRQDTTTVNFFDQIQDYDLSTLINPDSIEDIGPDGIERFKRSDPLGFIDTSYQRFQIHFVSVTKTKADPYLYEVIGKTKVKNNICSFKGTLKVTESRLGAYEDFPQYKQGYIICDVAFYENKNQAASGFIKGKLNCCFIIDSVGKISYDALTIVADGYSNNTFEGTWTSYKTKKVKKCNWGDFRIPDSHDLDGGVGEFIPMEKYLDNGWRTYYNCHMGFEDDPKRKEAERIENTEWWK